MTYDCFHYQNLSHCLTQRLDRGYCGDGVVGVDEDCDCGSVSECLDKKSLCVPPGRWRGETQCTARKLIRFEAEPRKQKGDTCTVLSLVKCTCPYHENSVLSCEDDVYCQRSSTCLPVSEWASRIFQEVQVRILTHTSSKYNPHFKDYIYRNCWTGVTLKNCVTSSRKWETLLSDLEQYKASSYGKV